MIPIRVGLHAQIAVYKDGTCSGWQLACSKLPLAGQPLIPPVPPVSSLLALEPAAELAGMEEAARRPPIPSQQGGRAVIYAGSLRHSQIC